MATANKNLKSKHNEYFESVGRRKTSIARVRIFNEKGGTVINGKPVEEYFHTADEKKIASDALSFLKFEGKYSVSAKINGGGIHSQAEALRHGIARALIKMDESLRSGLKKEGFLRRDPRMKERRKFGLKKARKAPQWAKR